MVSLYPKRWRVSLLHDVQDLEEADGTEVSPGFFYLERVCQVLEDIARQQIHNRALRMEMSALREHQGMQSSQVKIHLIHLYSVIKRPPQLLDTDCQHATRFH